VVLAGREHIQADFLGLERNRDHLLDALGLAYVAAPDGVGCHVTDCEDPELHVYSWREMTRAVPSPVTRMPQYSCARN
jgi:hypothetical protein